MTGLLIGGIGLAAIPLACNVMRCPSRQTTEADQQHEGSLRLGGGIRMVTISGLSSDAEEI